jgi:hypothetical protein
MLRRCLVLPVLISTVALAGCTDDPDPGDGLPRTWSVPGDLCTTLDLVGRLTAAGEPDAQALTEQTDDAVDTDAVCEASAGETTVVVRLRTPQSEDRFAEDHEVAAGRVAAPGTWSGLGTVDEVSHDPATWAQEGGSKTFTLMRSSADPDLADAAEVLRADLAVDDNLIVNLSVQTSGLGAEGAALADRVDGLADSVVADLPDLLEKS